MWRKEEERLENCSFVLILDTWKERNRLTYANTKIVDQVVKQSLCITFLEWIREFIGDCSMSITYFINWLKFYVL